MAKQYEYECVCGYCWIDDKNDGWLPLRGCPMCGEKIRVTITTYESLPPEKFNKK